jgi:hypothetical protein
MVPTLFACKLIRPVLLLQIWIRILVESRIRIRIKVKRWMPWSITDPHSHQIEGRILIRIKTKGRIRIRIRVKVKIRIRIRIIADLFVSNPSTKVAYPGPHCFWKLDLDSDPLE